MMWSYFWMVLVIYASAVVLAALFGVAYLNKHSIGPYDQCSIS